MIKPTIEKDEKNIYQQENERELDDIIIESECIGTIGSPSTTSEINLNILQDAVTRKLVGELVIFKYIQDLRSHYTLGQITEIELKNALLEDPTIKSVARQRGLVNPISGVQDTHVGKIICSSVFSKNKQNTFEPSFFGTVPSTGTYIYLTNDLILNSLLKEQLNEIFYLGKVYGSETKLPMWFKHFSDGDNGAGEAYHIGIFGRTGSGKSTLAKMILSAYSKYSQMGLLVLDPVGEISKDLDKFNDYDNSDNDNSKKSSQKFNINLIKILNSLQKKFEVINIRNLVLDRWELFEEILPESRFFNRLSITRDKKRDASIALINELQKKKITLDNLLERETFNYVIEILKDPNIQKLIYATPEPRERINTILLDLSDSDKNQIYFDIWKPICQLFNKRPGAHKIEHILESFRKEIKPLIIIDLSSQSARDMNIDYWNENIQALILKRLFKGLINIGEKNWKTNSSLNTLVVLDEAHRFASRFSRRDEVENNDLENIKHYLLDAVRTTRKYGLGWMFISTSLSSIHKDILQQLRIMFFGFGLSFGSDLIALKELVSDQNAIKLYQSFTDPANSFSNKSRKYSFMSQGPVSPLSFSGTPLFLNVYNSSIDFINSNRLYQTDLKVNNSNFKNDEYDF